MAGKSANISLEQKRVLSAIWQWLKKPQRQFLTLGGYAGTGKTTLIAILARVLHKSSPKLKIAFVSFTGKAAMVLKTSLQQAEVGRKQDFVGTIHSLIYEPIVGGRGEVVAWQKKSQLKADLIIVDEASMIDEQLWQDLLSYDLPILAVGDHGQLPPINGRFNLMAKPDLVLEKIHRQAVGNPIIQLSIMARQEGRIPYRDFGPGVKKISQQDPWAQEEIFDLLGSNWQDTLVLCGYNFTRVKLNRSIRQLLGFEVERPMVGDRVICLRNNHRKQIFNGMVGEIQEIEPDDGGLFYSKIYFSDSDHYFQGLISKEQFNFLAGKEARRLGARKKRQVDFFDFGYAMTVHKAQGSQAPRVILFEERFSKMSDDDWRRWLYTAVTRATQELYIIGKS